MKQHPTWEAWSEWVDGESTDAAAMQRHLDECPLCVKQVNALKALLADMRQLPELEVHPAFVTRVMAQAAQTSPKPRWFAAWHRILIPMAVAASFVLLVTVTGLWRTMPGASRTTEEAVSPLALRLAEAVEGYSEAANEGEIWELGMADNVTPDDLVAGVAETEAFASLASACDDDTDLDNLVGSLDEGETDAFHGLVRAYAQEDQIL